MGGLLSFQGCNDEVSRLNKGFLFIIVRKSKKTEAKVYKTKGRAKQKKNVTSSHYSRRNDELKGDKCRRGPLKDCKEGANRNKTG